MAICQHCGTLVPKVYTYYSSPDSPEEFRCGTCVGKAAYYHCDYCPSNAPTFLGYSLPLKKVGEYSPYCCPNCYADICDERGDFRPVSCRNCGCPKSQSAMATGTATIHLHHEDVPITSICKSCESKLQSCSICATKGLLRSGSLQTYSLTRFREAELTREELARIPLKGKIVCSHCSRDRLRTCDICGKLSQHIADGICPDCTDKQAVNCDLCGKKTYIPVSLDGLVHDPVMQKDICKSCYQAHLGQCSKCGKPMFPRAKTGHWHHYSQHYCCQCTSIPLVHSHNYAPKLRFYGAPEMGLFFGVENEINFKEIASSAPFRRRFKNLKDRIWLMHDGSLTNGIEVGYHPMSYEEWEQNPQLVPDVHDLVDPNFTGQGTHIHLSKGAFSKLHLYRFLGFLTDNAKQLQIIARRKFGDKYAFWRNTDPRLGDIVRKKRRYDRYRFVNVTDRTVEVRMFLSAWDYPQMMIYIQLLDAIFYYTMRERRKEMNWSNFVAYVHKAPKNYIYLKNEIASKKGLSI